MTWDKAEWQRKDRQAFAEANGFSKAAHYATGGLRKRVLERDGYACVGCGMTDAEHRLEFGRPITIDHRDKDRAHNTMDNLQTLCLPCHGHKDLIPELRAQKGPQFKDEILALRGSGWTYRAIAKEVGLNVSTVFIWFKLWSEGKDFPWNRQSS